MDLNTRLLCQSFNFSELLIFVVLFHSAYVNGKRPGRALEEPFQRGYRITKEKSESNPRLDVQDEFILANNVLQGLEVEFTNSQRCKVEKGIDSQMKIAQWMKDLGMER